MLSSVSLRALSALSVAALSTLSASAFAQNATAPLSPITPTALESTAPCNRCYGNLLPGRIVSHPETKWGIISDLPESFKGFGVLYSTRSLLPPNGAPEEMRKQVARDGFTTIDDGFDLFLFHLNKQEVAQRIVIYARNQGKSTVRTRPLQVIKSEGIIGTQHEFESTLTTRVMGERWDGTKISAGGPYPEITFGDIPGVDQKAPEVSIPPGQGRVLGYSKVFGKTKNGPDSSNNVNCFGYLRVDVESAVTPDLEVSVVAIPGTDRLAIQRETEKVIDQGVQSTDEVAMDSYPKGCAVARAVGTYRNFRWVSDRVVLDATKISAEGTSFPIALPQVQTDGCPDARQTQDLVLRPGYTREDTVGNYMIENEATFSLVHPTSAGPNPVAVDLVFGKEGADIGLAYATAVTDGATTQANPFQAVRMKSLWAGPKQSAREKSLLERPVILLPGQTKTVHVRWVVVPNSSLPFTLGLKSVSPKP